MQRLKRKQWKILAPSAEDDFENYFKMMTSPIVTTSVKIPYRYSSQRFQVFHFNFSASTPFFWRCNTSPHRRDILQWTLTGHLITHHMLFFYCRSCGRYLQRKTILHYWRTSAFRITTAVWQQLQDAFLFHHVLFVTNRPSHSHFCCRTTAKFTAL